MSVSVCLSVLRERQNELRKAIHPFWVSSVIWWQKKNTWTYRRLQGINTMLGKMSRGCTNSRRQRGQRVPLQLAAAADGEAPGPQPWLNTYSWSCTVFLSRPMLPWWEELAPGSSALALGAQKAQSKPHRKGILSSRRDLMVTGTLAATSCHQFFPRREALQHEPRQLPSSVRFSSLNFLNCKILYWKGSLRWSSPKVYKVQPWVISFHCLFFFLHPES